MTKLKGVAIGAGYFSQFHFDAWSRIESVQLSAICDADAHKSQQAAKQYNVARCYTDFAEMLATERPDFVDIITRPDSHLALTQQAVDAGVAVICQKPLAPTLQAARQLVQSATRANVPLMVHENFRFQPWHREIKRLLDDQVIGDRLHSIQMQTRTGDGWQSDAYLARQPYFREMERFLIFETGVHFIDTFRYLAGEIDGVYASLRKLNPDIAGEDAGTVLFEFANGAEGIWDANRFNEPNADDARYTFGEATIEGNRGTIRLYADGRMTLQLLGKPEAEHAYSHGKRNFAGDCVYTTQAHFVDCLVNSKPFETSGEEYLNTLAVQEAVYASAKARMPIRGLATLNLRSAVAVWKLQSWLRAKNDHANHRPDTTDHQRDARRRNFAGASIVGGRMERDNAVALFPLRHTHGRASALPARCSNVGSAIAGCRDGSRLRSQRRSGQAQTIDYRFKTST